MHQSKHRPTKLAFGNALANRVAHYRPSRTGLLLGSGAGAVLLLLLSWLAPQFFWLSARIFGILAVIVGATSYAGFGLTWFLRSWRLAPVLPLFTPLIGIGGILVVAHALGYLPIGAAHLAWPILGGFTVVNIVAWRQGARPRWRAGYTLPLLAGLVALLIGLWPLLRLGFITTVGGSIDPIYYLVRAEYRQMFGVMLIPPEDLLHPPFMGHIRQFMDVREGDTFLLGMFSSLLGIRPHFVYTVMTSFWYALTAIGVFLFANHTLRLNRWLALAASLLLAGHSLVHTSTINNGFSQTGGIAIWAFVLVAVLAAMRSGGWRTIGLAALLIAVLAAIYPPYIVYMVPVVGVFVLGEMLMRSWNALGALPRGSSLRERWQAVRAPVLLLTRRGLAVILTTVLVMPMAWLLLVNHLELVDRITGREVMPARGDIRDFPHPGELFGVINHAQAVYPHHQDELSQLSPPTATVLLLGCVLLVGYAVLRSPAWQRWLFAPLCLVFGLGLWQLRFWLNMGAGDAYLYYKVISLFSPFAITMAVVGGYRLYSDARRWLAPLAGDLRGMLVLFYLVVLTITMAHGLSIAHLVGGGAYVSANRYLLEFEETKTLLPDDAPVVILDQTNPGQIWTGYILDRPGIFYRQQPATYWTPTQSYSDELIEYAVLGFYHVPWDWHELAHEPWFHADQHEVLWQNDLYKILRRTDDTVAAFPLGIENLPVALGWPLVVELDSEHLHMRYAENGPANAPRPGILPSEGFRQRVAAPPAELVITLETAGTGHVRVAFADGRSETYPLTPGRHEVRYPASQPMTVSLTQEATEPVFVRDVRALGAAVPAAHQAE